MCGFGDYFDPLQRLAMRGEVGGVCSGTSKRKRPKLEECEGKYQINSQVESNCNYNGSGSSSQPKVRYRRPTRANNFAMSELPKIVLEDVTNVIQVSYCQESHFEDLSNSVQRSQVVDATNPTSDVLSYIEMSRYRAEKVLSTIRVSSAVPHVAKIPNKCGHVQMLNCDTSNIISCRASNVSPPGIEKKLSYKSVNKIICDLSHQFSVVEGCDVISKVDVVDERRSKGRSKGETNARFEAFQPLRRSKRFKPLSDLMNSESGKDNVKKYVGQSSVSTERSHGKENIDPVNIRGGDKDYDNISYFGTVCDPKCKAGVVNQRRSKRERKVRVEEVQPLRRSKRFKLFV
ncbi:hypothetical protein RIF29_28436 [Crotalaria pallida]|uniref:Uncharacterized protein n=1 Tax=Crotalaria pallida TaxID=3830 RepID=A0AAN9EDN5_CROPI